MRNILIISIILTTCTLTAYGQQPHEYADSTATTSASPKTGFIDKIVRYFSESNKRSDKAFDFSIIGGPHYSSDTKFGIGLVAAGLYRHNRTDTTIQPSNVSFYGDVSTVGFYLGGIRGSHIFPADRFRLNYKVYFYSFPTHFWGIGYHMGENSDNDTKYKRLQSKAEATFLCRLAPNIYIGPSASFQYVDARQVDHPDLWEGQALKTTNFSLGLEFSYDSRDFIANASKGVYICMSQHFYPRVLGNRKYNFSLTEITANNYSPLWKGAILASQIHGRFTYGHTPWGLLSTLGGSESMRGYYDGRYRDMNAVDITLELRQKIYRRSGAVVWIGAGNVFPSLKQFRWGHTLPNYGIGYRWEFKQRMNVRLDLGFGRHTTGFVFNINEAF